MDEIWKDIKCYEGYYQVSNLGKVRSLDRYVSGKNDCTRFQKGILMNLQKNRKGYLQVVLHKYGIYDSRLVHRLVADTYIPNYNNLPQINHRDTDKSNNSINNLEWITNDDNQKHAIEHGCYKAFTDKQLIVARENITKASISRRKIVVQKDLNDKILNIFESTAAAEKATKTDNSKICLCCNGKRHTANNFKWSYYKEENINE